MKKERMVGTRLLENGGSVPRSNRASRAIRPLDNCEKTPISGNTGLETRALFATVWQRQAHPGTCCP